MTSPEAGGRYTFLPLLGAAVAPTKQATSPPAQEPRLKGVPIKAKISHYWPPWGGPNCANFVGGKCISRTASGQSWEKWVDKGCGCPREYPFGTKFLVLGKVWTCVDRGGKVVTLPNGVIWLDLLTKKAPVPYGTVITVELLK